MQNHLQEVENIFIALANPERAIQMKEYMRNQFAFYGIMATERKMSLKEYIKQYGLPKYTDLPDFLGEAWSREEREYQYFAMELAEKHKKNYEKGIISTFELMITQKSWWDTVDFIASHLVAEYFLRFPEEIEAKTGEWMASGNMWLQRTCLIFQLFYKEKTNQQLLFSFIEQTLHSNEFFLQKAIGWALRSLARTDAESVKDFVFSHDLKPLSKREALKHFQ
jgi:3-methyladenine DNA glycosylase AlkD